MFCPRCGKKLEVVAKNNKEWGEFCEGYRAEDGTEWFLCSNKDCVFSSAPLVFFNSYHGWNHPAGDNWAIGYVK